MLVESGRFLRRRVDISRNLTLVEFSRFLRYRVDSYRNFRLVDLCKGYYYGHLRLPSGQPPDAP